MKKLLAILVVLTLVTGAVFAEVTVGAWTGATAKLVGSSGVKDGDYEADVIAGRYGFGGRLEGTGENEEGTFGGHVKVFSNDGEGGVFGWAWWKPVDQFRLQIGQNKWSDWQRDNIIGWGFTGGAQDGGVSDGYNDYGNGLGAMTGFYEGFGDFGALVSLSPVAGLTLNIGLPFVEGKIEDTYMKLHAQVLYDIGNVGTAAVTFQSNKGYLKPGDWKAVGYPKDEDFDFEDSGYYYKNGENYLPYAGSGANPVDPTLVLYKPKTGGYNEGPAKIFASFDLAGDLGLNIGFGLTMPKDYGDGILADPDDPTAGLIKKENAPLEVGVGFNLNNDAFGIKARVAAKLAGNKETKIGDETFTINDPIQFGLTVLPSFGIGAAGRLFINAGIVFTGESEEVNDEGKVAAVKDSSSFGWHFNPYIQKEIGSGSFFIGVQVRSDGVKGSSGDGDASKIEFAIPMGITFGF